MYTLDRKVIYSYIIIEASLDGGTSRKVPLTCYIKARHIGVFPNQ
jgi:hypothetical protein